MIPPWSVSGWAAIELVGDHLWQSTLCLAGAACLAWVLRHNRARVRHGVWLVASAKFLVPFAALVAMGGQLGWMLPANTMATPTRFVVEVVDTIGQPFSSRKFFSEPGVSPPRSARDQAATSTLLFAVWLSGAAAMFLRWWVRWRRVAKVVGDARPVFDGRVWAALRPLEARDGIKRPIPLVASGASLPPGVFGVWRPVLVWPRHLAGRLGPGQVDAILAHELSHVRRRDNLAAAIHQVVEAVFWFHPLAWWLGRRLVAEREQACDEAVLRWGGEPGAYAESILTTCRFAVESAPVGMVGVAGADLKRRMEQIMMKDKTRALTVWRKLLLTVMASTSVAGPIAVGVVGASPLVAQTGPPTVERLDDAVTLTGSAVRLDPAPAKGMAAVSQARPAFQGGAEALPGVSSQRSLVIDQAADDHVRFAGSVQLVGGADAEASAAAVDLANAPVTLTLVVNGAEMTAQTMTRDVRTYTWPVSGGAWKTGMNRVGLRVSETVSPAALGISDDQRVLGFALRRLQLTRLE